MILFDAERLKHPHFGFYTFSEHLGSALANEARVRGEKMGFFVPKDYLNFFGKDMYYKKVNDIYKLIFPIDNEIQLYHAGRQKSPYMPYTSKVRKLVTVHDLNFLYEKKSSEYKHNLNRYQRCINRADRIVAISEATKKDIYEHLDTKGKPVDVVYNGLYEFEGVPQEPAVKPRGNFIFSVATVNHKKNFHVLPALLEGNDYELVIAGRLCDKAYVKYILDEAKRWGVYDRVKILGPISNEVKYWYLQNCDAFAFPSIAEGFGFPILEAMYYGKPVFLSDHTCIPEIAGENAFYFNHDFDRRAMQQEFNAGIEAFLRGEVSVEKIVARAKSFTWARAAKQYFEIYDQLLER